MGNWKHFNRYGEPLWTENTPQTNRIRLALAACKPSKRPRGGLTKGSGYRGPKAKA